MMTIFLDIMTSSPICAIGQNVRFAAHFSNELGEEGKFVFSIHDRKPKHPAQDRIKPSIFGVGFIFLHRRFHKKISAEKLSFLFEESRAAIETEPEIFGTQTPTLAVN